MFAIDDTASLEGYTLVVPSLSIGSIGQLAMDLLINETEAVKIANGWHPVALVMVGAAAYDHSGPDIITAIELYCSEKHKLIFLQIRAPLIKAYISNALNMLIQHMKEIKIGRVIIITGADSMGVDKATLQNTIKCIVSPSLAASEKIFQSTSEQESNPFGEIKISEKLCGVPEYKMYNCGFSKQLYDLCVKNDLPTAILVKYCIEGYNLPHATEVVLHLDKWLHVIPDPANMKSVSSWKHIFGGPAIPDIF